MQFPVPQFIDVEDKIIGPFTLKQFGFVFGGGILVVGFFRLFGNGFLFYFFSIPVALVSAVFAFGSFNGRKLYDALPLFLKFFTSDKNLVFRRNRDVGQIDIQPITIDIFKKVEAQRQTEQQVEEPVQSRLKRISMLLDQKNQEANETLKQKRNA